MIRDTLVEAELSGLLERIEGGYEVDFDPLEPKKNNKR